MNKTLQYFLIAGITFAIVPVGLSLAENQKSSAHNIEIFVQGKRYKSIRDYRREQIKTAFEDVLSSRDLNEFSEDELFGILKEIHRPGSIAAGRIEKDLKPSTQATTEEEAQDLSTHQMQRMLENYLKERGHIDPIVIDPDKVKNVIIEN